MIFKIDIEDMVLKSSLSNTMCVLFKFIKKIIPILKQKIKKIEIAINSNNELKKRIYYGSIFAIITIFAILCGNVIYMLVVFTALCLMIYELLKMLSNIEETNNQMFIFLRYWGLIYIAICCVSLILIRESKQGLAISIWMFLTIWSVDCFSYIFGKKFGKLKLAPVVSPGKTYEGAIFGTIGGLFVSMICYKIFSTKLINSFSSVSFSLFSIIVIILAQLSDLSESYIKRQCCIKDSGNIIPGHGGILDRLDSILIVAPFVFIIVLLNGGVLF